MKGRKFDIWLVSSGVCCHIGLEYSLFPSDSFDIRLLALVKYCDHKAGCSFNLISIHLFFCAREVDFIFILAMCFTVIFLIASINTNAWPLCRCKENKKLKTTKKTSSNYQITIKVSEIIFKLFYFLYFSVSPHQPYPRPLPVPPLLTVLGWRLKSLEWALSNFYPSSFTASHDPWANGITPWLFLIFFLFLCTSFTLNFKLL